LPLVGALLEICYSPPPPRTVTAFNANLMLGILTSGPT
jgi:hypothetical protein